MKFDETGTTPGWRSGLSSTVSGSSGSSSFDALVERASRKLFGQTGSIRRDGALFHFQSESTARRWRPWNGQFRPLSEYLGRCFDWLGCFAHLSLEAQIRLPRMNVMLGPSPIEHFGHRRLSKRFWSFDVSQRQWTLEFDLRSSSMLVMKYESGGLRLAAKDDICDGFWIEVVRGARRTRSPRISGRAGSTTSTRRWRCLTVEV